MTPARAAALAMLTAQLVGGVGERDQALAAAADVPVTDLISALVEAGVMLAEGWCWQECWDRMALLTALRLELDEVPA